jgi:mercuric ion transport protein
MRAAIGGIGAALVASACCIGPVAFSLIGVGALGASAVKLEPYRPWFIGMTVLLTIARVQCRCSRPTAAHGPTLSACAWNATI